MIEPATFRFVAQHLNHCTTAVPLYMYIYGSLDSSVGIATRFGLDGPGIESRWGRDFPHLSRPALRPTQPPIQWVKGSFPGVKRPGRGVDHPPPSSAEVKIKVEIYLYSPLGLRGLFYGGLYLYLDFVLCNSLTKEEIFP